MKANFILKCKPEHLVLVKAQASDVGLSVTSFGIAPESKALTFSITGNHNTGKCFVRLLVVQKLAWATSDKKVETPSKV